MSPSYSIIIIYTLFSFITYIYAQTTTTTTTPTTTPTTSSLIPTSNTGEITLKITDVFAIRQCVDEFNCTSCQINPPDIKFRLNEIKTCTSINNWWTPQEDGISGIDKNTALGFKYTPAASYDATLKAKGYYAGLLEIFRIPYVRTLIPPRDKWNIDSNVNIPNPDDCNPTQLIRQFQITPLSTCGPTVSWSSFTGLLPSTPSLAPVDTQTAPATTPANLFPDTMSWMSWLDNSKLMITVYTGAQRPDNQQPRTASGGVCTDRRGSVIASISPFILTSTSTSASCCSLDCGTNSRISTWTNTSDATYGFQATFNIQGLVCPSLPSSGNTTSTTTTTPPTTVTPTTQAPTQPPQTNPCNQTHIDLIQKQCGYLVPNIMLTTNLSYINTLYLSTNITTLNTSTSTSYNNTVYTSYCSTFPPYQSCVQNLTSTYMNMSDITTCLNTVQNEMIRVVTQNQTVMAFNCSSLSPPTIPTPSCQRGQKLNITSNTCYNLTSCMLLMTETIMYTPVYTNQTTNTTTATTTTNTSTITPTSTTTNNTLISNTSYTTRIYRWESDVLYNMTSCVIPNITTNDTNMCILPLISTYNITTNTTTYTYQWNTTIGNCTVIPTMINPNITYNTSIIINTTTICNTTGTYYTYYNITNTTKNNTYYDGTIVIITNETSRIYINTTLISNITCISTTSAPTIPSSEVDNNGQNTDQNQTIDKAAGTAMALILGFSVLGVGALYWLWFRVRRQKQAFQRAQQHVANQQQQQDEEDEI